MPCADCPKASLISVRHLPTEAISPPSAVSFEFLEWLASGSRSRRTSYCRLDGRVGTASVAVMRSVALLPSERTTETGSGLPTFCASARCNPFELNGCPGTPVDRSKRHWVSDWKDGHLLTPHTLCL